MGGSYLAGGCGERIGLLLVLLPKEKGHCVCLGVERCKGRRCQSSLHSACEGSGRWGQTWAQGRLEAGDCVRRGGEERRGQVCGADQACR
jgi:hypothetical protein